jgi:Zn finger protein HypA/HybF involved in hydrogenase expression
MPIGEIVAMEKAKKNAKWFQCKKCMCSFKVEERFLNFCPNCGLQMHVVVDNNTRYGLPDWSTGADKKDGFCEYCRPPVGAYMATNYATCQNCGRELSLKDYGLDKNGQPIEDCMKEDGDE